MCTALCCAGRLQATTGKLVVGKEDIKDVSLKYRKNVLTKNKPDEEFKAMSRMKELLHEKQMKLRIIRWLMYEVTIIDQTGYEIINDPTCYRWLSFDEYQNNK